MLLPIMMHSQVLSSLGVAKEITKGTLPNGVEYYLVQNTSDKGFADYALVRTASLSIEDERKSLCGLPHFTDRKPWQFFSEHGVGYSSYGYYTEEGPAGVFRFSNVPVYNQSVADSTLLMLVDMTALSRSPQAVVVSGDINPSKLKERLNLLSMTVPQLDCPSGESSYKWVLKDSKRSILINNPSSDVAAISAIISSARTSRELMDSPQPIVTSMYAELVGKVISDRVRRDFRSRGIPLADVEFNYAGSDAGPSDERYGFTLYTSAKCANVATDCFARILSDLDRNGALMDEFVDAKAQLSGDVRSGRLAGKLDNAAYVDKWGIGHSSGVDFPGESLGIVKERDQYDGATLGSMSFGQALSVSPIEIARAVGGIANGGVMMTPHFYKSSKGDEKDWGEGERAISEDAASQVTSCMQTVVSEGTGVGGAVDGYDVAGKTGTAERADENGGYLKENYMSSFMGFAPAQSPKVLCYITLDGTPSGSDAAAVPFQSIMANALDVLGIPHTK